MSPTPSQPVRTGPVPAGTGPVLTALGRSGNQTLAHRTLALGAVLLGYLVVPMAMSGTSIALPHIAVDLGGGGGAVQWVITGYFLAASCLMLIAGSLGDLFGRRRVFRIGTTVYLVSTLVGAFADNILLLDVARTLCGVGAAGVMAGGGAILASTFDGVARTRAFASVGTMIGIGLAFGPTLSGWLISAFGWRAMFGIFAGAAAVVLLGTLFMTDTTADVRPKIDLPGAAAFVLGMAALMYGLNQVAQVGWGSPIVLGLSAAGLALFVLFVLVQQRSAFPILDLALVRNRQFVGWLLTALTTTIGTAGVLVYLPTYLQGAGGLSAADAGTVMLAITLPILVAPPVAGKLVNRGVSARLLMTLDMLLFAAGNAWLTVLDGSAVAGLLSPLILIGIANGVAAGIIDAQAMNLVDPDRVGMASGLLNTMRGGGNALVVAVFGAALVSLIQAGVGDRELAGRVAAGDVTGGDRAFLIGEFTGAWQAVLWGVAGLCALAGVAVCRLLRSRTTG